MTHHLEHPLISFVVAMTTGHVIGRENRLPWNIPLDLAHFRRLTLGKPVVMGRRTFEAIGRPLPQRHNVVVTRDRSVRIEGCTVVHSVDDALLVAGNVPEIAVIGGAQIFTTLLPRVDILHLTYIHAEIEGDTFFPSLNAHEWREHDRVELGVGPKDVYPLTFTTLCRRRGVGCSPLTVGEDESQ
jgi:dihydrofolate reductase